MNFLCKCPFYKEKITICYEQEKEEWISVNLIGSTLRLNLDRTLCGTMGLISLFTKIVQMQMFLNLKR